MGDPVRGRRARWLDGRCLIAGPPPRLQPSLPADRPLWPLEVTLFTNRIPPAPERDSQDIPVAPAEAGARKVGAVDWRRWALVLLLAAAALRLVGLAQNSLWVDEYASLVTARFPLTGIPAAALRGDAFEPPVYFWLLHLVIGRFGESEPVLRSVSVIAGAATVPLVMLLIRALGAESGTALLGAVLLALNPLHIWYSQEARPYALLVFFGVGSLVGLLYGLQRGVLLGWISFAVLGTLTVLTHLSGAVFPLIGCLWAVRVKGRVRVPRPLWIAALAILLGTAPFGFRLASAVGHAAGTGSPPRDLTGLEVPYTLFTYLAGYSLGPSVRELQNEGARAAVFSHAPETLLVAVTIAAVLALASRLRTVAASRLALLFVLPMISAALGSALTGKAYNVRYAVPGMVGFVGLAAMAISSVSRTRRRVLLVGLVGLCCWADAQWFLVPRYRKEDSRAAVAWLAANLLPGARVAVAPGYQAEVLAYYATRDRAPLTFSGLADTATALPPGPTDALLLTRLHHVPHWDALLRSARKRSPGLVRPGLVGYTVVVLSRNEPTPMSNDSASRPP